jgi:sugar phosphate isomerase/epimerase
MIYSRRELGKIALGALSTWGGVRIGINVPYSYRGLSWAAKDVFRYTKGLGLGAVELRSQTVEGDLGAPNSAGIEPEDVAAGGMALEKWRLAASIDRFKEFRKKYAGVAIPVVKFDGIDSMKDLVVDYAFRVAKALGARALACNVPLRKSRWLGEIAARHKMMVGYHGHEDVHDPEAFATPESWEKAMSYSRYNGINLDIGHFVAANNISPIPFMKKYAERITHVHLTDRKRNGGAFTVWGEGDTPMREVLQTMKKEKYPFPAIIEYEYPTPQGSDTLTEIAKCVAYARNCLV